MDVARGCGCVGRTVLGTRLDGGRSQDVRIREGLNPRTLQLRRGVPFSQTLCGDVHPLITQHFCEETRSTRQSHLTCTSRKCTVCFCAAGLGTESSCTGPTGYVLVLIDHTGDVVGAVAFAACDLRISSVNGGNTIKPYASSLHRMQRSCTCLLSVVVSVL